MDENVAIAPETCECTLRIAGAPLAAGVEVSIDGSEYRPCRLVDGEWRLHWETPLVGEPVVAVIRAARR
jgi:hypothetical protein